MLELTKESTAEEIKKVYSLERGDVFKVANRYEGEWETITRRIFEDYYPTDASWNAVAITPGTDLYTIYGADCFVVTDNSKKQDTPSDK